MSAPIEIAVPPKGAAYDDRGRVLRVTGVAGGPLEFRVDEGLVFARYLSQEPRLWTSVALTSVMAFFVEESPVSTYLRQQGAFPLRQLLLDSLTTVADAGDTPA